MAVRRPHLEIQSLGVCTRARSHCTARGTSFGEWLVHPRAFRGRILASIYWRVLARRHSDQVAGALPVLFAKQWFRELMIQWLFVGCTESPLQTICEGAS